MLTSFRIVVLGIFFQFILSKPRRGGGGTRGNSRPRERSKNRTTAVPINSAYKIYQSLDKQVSFRISSRFPQQKYLHTNHFVKYKKKSKDLKEGLENQDERGDGYLNFLVIGQKGIYIKELQKPWEDFQPAAMSNKDMRVLKQINSTDYIMSCQMISNETIFSVFYSNFTVEVLELVEDSSKSDQVYKLSTKHSFDVLYEKEVVRNSSVRPIEAIPYSDYILFSPNRFLLYKANRLTGQLQKQKAFLDATRYIRCPTATFRHKDNPHNPKRIRRKWLSDQSHKLGTEPRCVLTGHSVPTNPTNVVIDWTTMKPVAYWNLGLMGGYPEDRANVVESITFFGGIPSASMYVFTTMRSEKYVFLFDTITNRQIHKYFDFQKAGSKIVNWINGTLYVSVYIRTPTVNFPGGSQLVFLKIFGPKSYRVYNNYVKNMNDKAINNYAIARVFLEDGGNEHGKDQFDGYEDLDEYYLGYYIMSNELHVEPPVISWDHCLGRAAESTKSSSKGNLDGRMLYGRYRVCEACVDGYVNQATGNRNLSEFREKNRTLISCQKKDCNPVKIQSKNQINTIEVEVAASVHSIQVFIQKSVIEQCVARYEVPAAERGFVNDNGCSPGFNRDYFGVCRNCFSAGRDHISNCLFFTVITAIREDYTANIMKYDASRYNQRVIFKGFEELGKIVDYKSLYFWDSSRSEYTSIGKDRKTTTTVWKDQQVAGSELCYRLDLSSSDKEGYMAMPARGYRLEPMKKFPWIDTTAQKAKYPNGTLNNMICVKYCEVGKYYEFESMTCRKCGLGCAECHKFDTCDVCIPGFSLVKKPIFRALDRGFEVETCLPGCQKGFYQKRFNGTCFECPKGCEVCRDRSIEELTRISQEEVQKLGSSAFCTICEKPGDNKTSILMDNYTGKCIESCSGDGKVVTKRKTFWFGDSPEGYEYQICSRCHDPRCKKCSTPHPDGCLECQNGLFLEKDPKGSTDCLKFTQLNKFRSLIFFGFLTFSVILISLAICAVGLKWQCCCKESKKGRDSKRKGKSSLFETEVGKKSNLSKLDQFDDLFEGFKHLPNTSVAKKSDRTARKERREDTIFGTQIDNDNDIIPEEHDDTIRGLQVNSRAGIGSKGGRRWSQQGGKGLKVDSQKLVIFDLKQKIQAVEKDLAMMKETVKRLEQR